MQNGLCKGLEPLSSLIAVAALIFLSVLPLSAFSHAELVLQIESLDTQIIADPGNAGLLIKRGDLNRLHEDYPAAAQDFAAARKSGPDNTLVDFYEGRLLFDQGDAAGAELLLGKYLLNHPEHAKAWALRGEVNIRLQQPKSAAEYFSQAIEQTGSPSPSLYRLQILALASTDKNKWQEAIQVAEAGLQHFGLEVTLLGLAIDIALADNQADKARQYLESLPQALRALPQWASRIQTADCMTLAAPEVSAACLRLANDQLATEVNAFMAL